MSIEGPELDSGIRAGDPDAQRRVVEAYLPQILRASRSAGLDGAAAEDVLADAGPWLRLKVRLHLLICRHCAQYAAQIRAIGVKARERFHPADERSDVEDLQRRILESADKSGTERDP